MSAQYSSVLQVTSSSNNASGDEGNVYFPFLDPHPGRTEPYRTNARLTDRDFRPDRTVQPRGPDYGVFNFADLFSEALLQAPFESLEDGERKDLIDRFQFKVSDQVPLWIRLPVPE